MYRSRKLRSKESRGGGGRERLAKRRVEIDDARDSVVHFNRLVRSRRRPLAQLSRCCQLAAFRYLNQDITTFTLNEVPLVITSTGPFTKPLYLLQIMP